MKVLDQREARMRRLFAGMRDAGIDEAHRHAWAAHALRVQSLQSFRELSSEQVGRLIDHLEYPPEM